MGALGHVVIVAWVDCGCVVVVVAARGLYGCTAASASLCAGRVAAWSHGVVFVARAGCVAPWIVAQCSGASSSSQGMYGASAPSGARMLSGASSCSGPIDPLIVAQVLGHVVFVGGAVWPRRRRRARGCSRRVVVVHVGSKERLPAGGCGVVSHLPAFGVPGSIGSPMHERAKRRTYHSNGCPT